VAFGLAVVVGLEIFSGGGGVLFGVLLTFVIFVLD
jgi:hypothetical protein